MRRRSRSSAREQGEDQYGSVGVSQDRDDVSAAIREFGARRGGSGGPRVHRSAEGMVYTGRVPKFVKDLEQRLGYKRKQADLSHSDSTPPEDHASVGEEVEQGSAWAEGSLNTNEVRRRNGAERAMCVAQERAEEEKARGNEAFKNNDFAAAIRRYTLCIELAPKNAVYYSNRSSAYARQGLFEKALEDAEAATRLNREWPRGWARLAEAHFGLEQYSDAKEGYRRAATLAPGAIIYTEGLAKCVDAERRQIAEGKHKLKKRSKGTVASPSSVKKTRSAQKPCRVEISYSDPENQD